MAQQLNDNEKFTGVRLPTQVKPVHYDLTLTPDLKNFTFEGSVKIDYEASTPSNEVVVHALELVITEGSVQSGDTENSVCTLTKVIYSEKTETATLVFSGPIPNVGKLVLNFTGVLNDKMAGFYRTEFKIDDVSVYSATTQFESTDARRCFPCWDEPAIKATFSVTMRHEKLLKFQGKTKSHEYQVVALSNTPVIEDKTESDKQVVKFDKTPIMSTYLLAFIVGPFEYVEASDGKRPIRVYTTPGKKELGRFALDVSCKSLAFYENYFKIDYPLAKMDLIAIPDFSSGAMENWGLVTYRETCLLVDPINTATNTRQWVALVVAHELAHQWFGNLVTMEWWTHLWLNEGFATFMEYLCVDSILPEFDVWSRFISFTYCEALSLDALRNSHPIEVPVEKASEINEIFDSISYSKGASIIRMLYNYIGDDSFRVGMHDYLSKFAYKNAVTEDLWECLEKASNKPVCELMSGWTSQRGYPYISVSYSLNDDGDSAKLTLAQNRFSADGKISEGDDATLWCVPIDAITSANPTKQVPLGLLKEREGVMVVNVANDSWLKLNPASVGVYRTAYSEDMMKKLLPAIQDLTLPAIDRLGIQNDYNALCEAGKVSTTELLTLLGAYTEDTEVTVWRSIDSCCANINTLLQFTDFQEKFHAFGRKLYASIFKKLGWVAKDKEPDSVSMTRTLIINRLIMFGDETVIGEAKRRFRAHVDQVEAIPADLRSVVYKAIVCYGSDEDYEKLFDIHKKAELTEEKDRVARTLGFAKDIKRLNRAIDFALSDEVKLQDKLLVIVPMGASNPAVAWKFVQDQKDMLREKYTRGHLLCSLISSATENFASEEMALEISKFFEENEFSLVVRTVKQSVETIRLNAEWLARDGDAIRAFLSS